MKKRTATTTETVRTETQANATINTIKCATTFFTPSLRKAFDEAGLPYPC